MRAPDERADRGGRRATRRAVLAGLGAVGLGTVGAATGRARGAPASGSGVERSASGGEPFADPAALEAAVDRLMAERVGEETPGAAVAVVEGDVLRLAKGYGVADVATGEPVRADGTAFRVGSVGKLVTWTAVVRGVQRGVLDLDADVNGYLDGSAVRVPNAHDAPVTLRHLGTHTAGFESTMDPALVADPGDVAPLETLLVERRPDRVRPPGAAVGYSNYGAALAGHVVAEAHDATFAEHARSALFDPLGMTHATFAGPRPDARPGDLAAGHRREGESFAPASRTYVGLRPAGSLSATATDMARFASAHLGDRPGAVGDARVLDPGAARAMHRVHHVRHPAVNNWRYGFHGYGAPDANLLAHSGATLRSTSLLVLAPDHDVGVFVSYNTGTDVARLEAVVDAVLDEYGLRPAPSRPAPTAAPGGRERAAVVAGEYGATFLPEHGPLRLADVLARLSVRARGDGRLVTETPGGDAREWVETEPHVFREVGGRDVLAFETTDGAVDALNVSSVPQGVHEPVPLHERRAVTGGVVGASLGGFALSLLGEGGVRAWRRWGGADASSPTAAESGEGSR